MAMTRKWPRITRSSGSSISAPRRFMALAQTSNPPPGHFDIPPGFDFPASKATLEQFVATGNISGERNHVWNVFAGMTQTAPGGQYTIFETWYDEDQTFNANATVAAVTPRIISPHFRVPQQFLGPRGAVTPAVAGQSTLSFVLYNFAAYNHIRSNGLYQQSTLDTLVTATYLHSQQMPSR
jgi:hypothetical protein